MGSPDANFGAHWDHEPVLGAAAFWSAAVLCRFRNVGQVQKRQRTGAVQNLAADRTVHGKLDEREREKRRQPIAVSLTKKPAKLIVDVP